MPPQAPLAALLARTLIDRKSRQSVDRATKWKTSSCLDAMEQAGPGVDLVEAFALPVPSFVIGELMEAGEEGVLSNEEIVGLVGMLIVAGHETTTSTIALAALALMQQPDQLAVLLDEKASTTNAAEEILRHTAVSSTFPRAAREDTVVAGRDVKAGERVLVSLLNANRDPALVSGDPDKLDSPGSRSHT